MVATEPITEFLPIRRIHKGRPVLDSIMVVGYPSTDALPCRLFIGADWSERQQRFRDFSAYCAVELECTEGRLVKLIRSASAVQADPERVTHYNVLICNRTRNCDCMGFAAKDKVSQPCKHTVSVAWLLSEGLV